MNTIIAYNKFSEFSDDCQTKYTLYHCDLTNQRHCPVVILRKPGISARSANRVVRARQVIYW